MKSLVWCLQCRYKSTVPLRLDQNKIQKISGDAFGACETCSLRFPAHRNAQIKSKQPRNKLLASCRESPDDDMDDCRVVVKFGWELPGFSASNNGNNGLWSTRRNFVTVTTTHPRQQGVMWLHSPEKLWRSWYTTQPTEFFLAHWIN